ncbi:unnamed protein product [Pieris macdunnoughi]|uniref:Uncharacterized protein n=1 Tax=Pieris macdunnoughi TaxID=345717 RepID=A0A821TY55_9NEOP|nr:unnamed protein product [Pieris macdunnoughi]
MVHDRAKIQITVAPQESSDQSTLSYEHHDEIKAYIDTRRFSSDFTSCSFNGSRNDIIKASIKHLSMWPNFTQLQLVHNMRAHDDLEFAQWVLKVGDVSANEDSNDHIELPQRCIVDNSIVDHIFGVSLNTNDYKSYSMKSILTPKNDDCF